MFQEVWQEFFIFVDCLGCELDLSDDLVLIFGGEVFHLDVFDLVPTLFDDVEFRRVGRQPLEMKLRRMFAFVLRLQTFVTLKIIPDNDDLALVCSSSST